MAKKRKSSKITFTILAALVALAFVSFNVLRYKEPARKANRKIPPKFAQAQEIPFKKQGELQLTKADGSSLNFDIEIADTPEKRAKGLMFRNHLPEMAGMLFLFDEAGPRSFWMKNTFISLDILYINADKSVVQIYENTQVKSTQSLICEKPALYVLELNGGTCEKLGVKEGDKIEYQKF
jgi:uncharacterized membrane protein (UPF0127 family)